jgi:hypothetical protein
MSPVGLKFEKGCAGDARQKVKSADPTSRQERALHINKPETVKKKSRMGWSRVLNVCLIPRRTGRQTVGRNITLTLTCCRTE